MGGGTAQRQCLHFSPGNPGFDFWLSHEIFWQFSLKKFILDVANFLGCEMLEYFD